MRIFVVNEEYDKAEVCAQLIKKHEAEVKECDTILQALEETGTFTEDKISVIILNTVRENEIQENKTLYVQTFGNFEVFYRGEPMAFIRAKSKELFAYLIDRRGAAVTTAEACGILWEDKEYDFSLQRQFQTVVSDLIKSLKRAKSDHLIHRRRNCLSVDVSGLECDFYKLLAGDIKARENYNGEYMANYSWAEMTAGFLLQKHRKSAMYEEDK